MGLARAGVLVVACAALAGCHKAPDCEAAISSLVKRVPFGDTAHRAASAACVGQAFSAELRDCLADADAEPALQACIAKEPSLADATKRMAALRDGAAAWTPAKQAELDKLAVDQEALMKQMEDAYDSIVDAKTVGERDTRRATLDDLRTKHNALDAPIAAAKIAKTAAEAADEQRKRLCGDYPLLTGCH